MHLGTMLRDMLKSYSQWLELQVCSLILSSHAAAAAAADAAASVPPNTGTRFIGNETSQAFRLGMETSQCTVATTNVTTEKGMFIFE